ncbi:RHS repeat protein [Shewanella algae]|nr:RHS repeat protein [Shewanella algae]
MERSPSILPTIDLTQLILTHLELPDGQRYRYRYDPFGRRIAKKCERSRQQSHYLWDGATLVQHCRMTADGTPLSTIEYRKRQDSHIF